MKCCVAFMVSKLVYKTTLLLINVFVNAKCQHNTLNLHIKNDDYLQQVEICFVVAKSCDYQNMYGQYGGYGK